MRTKIAAKILVKNQNVIEDEYGYIKNITGVIGGHRTIFHNEIHTVIASSISNSSKVSHRKHAQTYSSMQSIFKTQLLMMKESCKELSQT